MGLRDLAQAGVVALLRDAAALLDERGLAVGMTVDVETGALDVHGALLVAAGARHLDPLSTDPVEARVPPVNQARVYVAFDVLDALVGDLDAWSDNAEVATVVQRLRQAADRLDIAVS
jgi:hypothetical protein